MAENQQFDYIIVGNGLAGLQLALELSKHSFFNTKQIALIDKDEKTSNDKTWSFWEEGKGSWDDLVSKSWDKSEIYALDKRTSLDLCPYVYKSIRSLDFYKHAKDELAAFENFHFVIDEVQSIDEDPKLMVLGSKGSYFADHVFDSRLPEAYFEPHKYTKIIQHFKGVVIETSRDVFDPTNFIMMDYRIKDGDQTTFTYVLPYSSNKALIEFTYFTAESVNESVYDHYIKTYLSEIWHLDDYKIVEMEQGQIPMTDFPFYKYSTQKVTKIGTGGGWVKGSTGYSFKHTEKKNRQIALNLKNGEPASKGLFKSRFLFYDRIFLKVLHDQNQMGEWIFSQFYRKNRVETMFRFLDEESSFSEELAVMGSLFSWTFIKAFFKTL